jgi:hypothetical protein
VTSPARSSTRCLVIMPLRSISSSPESEKSIALCPSL